MTNLARARESARACRFAVGGERVGLLGRLTDYLWAKYQVEPRAATAEKMGGSLAELRGRVIFYDESLDDDPDQLLLVLAHELGHLSLHPRVRRRSGPVDPVLAASYLAGEQGVALARYNPKAREEAEAIAFATEFVCPSDAAFDLWRASPAATSASVARVLGVDRDTCRAQLVEGLAAWLSRDRAPIPKSGASFVPNSSQRAAIDYRDGPALVDAGPGTGKTATLVARVRALVDEGVAPSSILVLTFSNEAAGELRSRIEPATPGDAALEITVSTIHGLGRELLHLHGDHVGVSPNASVLDEYGQVDLVLKAMGQLPPSCLFEPARPRDTALEAVRHINRVKQRVDDLGRPWTAQALRALLSRLQDAPPSWLAFADLFETYEALKQEAGALDFSDLVALPVRVLTENADIRFAYHRKYQHVLVDEFQDVTRSCALLLRALTSEQTPPWVVGDPRQAIYRFLGAAPENVTEFGDLFGTVTPFALSVNYRSHPDIVAVANALVASSPDTVVAPEGSPMWTTASGEAPTGEPVFAVAESDAAEVSGAVEHVLALLADGVPEHHVAVLARRNLDVQRVVTALAEQGVPANAAGTLSSEGAAGDLAAVLTLADAPRASVPRVIHALGDDLERGDADRAISTLLAALHQGKTFDPDALETPCPDVVFDVVRAAERLREERFTSDGFGTLVAFLFDGGTYLRRLVRSLSSSDAERSALASHRLSEVVASLARAASYRVLQPGLPPKDSRLQFAEHFRRTLADTTPTAVTPRPVDGVVQVMTCHASKGLEFEHVVLIGQSAPGRPCGYPWVPDLFSESLGSDEQEQADALLFVGATRAKRSLLVSYSTSATGAARSTRRSPSRLLKRWADSFGPAPVIWPAPPPEATQHVLTLEWGEPPRSPRLRARSLDSSTCALKVAVEDDLGLRFPEAERPLYPPFFEVVRFVLSQVLKAAWSTGESVSRAAALGMLQRAWATAEPKPHPHGDLYRTLAEQYVARFARAYRPGEGSFLALDNSAPLHPGGPDVELGLVAAFIAPDRTPTAILFRPESFVGKLSAGGKILWSKLSSNRRIPFVLLRETYPDLDPYVFSGDDGVIYPFAWSTTSGSEEKQAESARERARSLASRHLNYKVSDWLCDRCSVRVGCPHHLRTRGRDFF